MFEKFTKKAIDVLLSAQNHAIELKHQRICSEHILLGLKELSKGVQEKILGFDKIDIQELKTLVAYCQVQQENLDSRDIFFSIDTRTILKKTVELTKELNSKFTMPQHLALAIFLTKESGAYRILRQFNIDEEKIIPNLKRILDKSSDIKPRHPEIEEIAPKSNINDFFREKTISQILSNAQSKLSAKGYEILGTEQLLQSILDNEDYKITQLLNKYSIDSKIFQEHLDAFSSRNLEFENSEKQIIFTPNAFSALLAALDLAKETGSVGIEAQHVVLGILKIKKGIAYKILSSLITDKTEFFDSVIKKTNENIPETLMILRLAKQEARDLNTSTIGTEIILLGILSYGAGVAYETLKRLGITLKDARNEVRKLIVPQKEVEELVYSSRAQQVLELAYKTAREHKRSAIKSENLLYGITKTDNCLAMTVLSNLGTDKLELQQGIKQELLGGMDL